MKRIIISVVVFATVLFSISYGRTWTDKKGRQITADYVSLLQLDEPKVKLLKPNGEYILVPVKALSAEDQDYIQGLNGNNPVNVSAESNNPQGTSTKNVSESVVYPAMKNLDIGSREAYDALIQLRDSDPTKLEPDYTLGLLFIFKNKNYLEAQKHFSRCQKISPDNAGVLLNLGTLCILQGKYPEAYGYYQKVYTLGGANNTLNQNLHKLIEESSTRNIFLPATVRNKFIELSGKVSPKAKTKYNSKQGWMFAKCSEGSSQESHKCHWFQLKGYRPYEFPVCPKCNGTGKAECPNKNCSGGKVPVMVNKTTRVPNGRSVTMQVREHKTCDVCKGKNHVVCSVCKGSGLEFKLSSQEIERSNQLNRNIFNENNDLDENDAIEENNDLVDNSSLDENDELDQMAAEAEKRRAEREKDTRIRQVQNAIEEAEREKVRQAQREIEEKERQAQKEREEQIKKEKEEKRLQAIKERTIRIGDCDVSIINFSKGFVPLRNESSGGPGISYGRQNVQERILRGMSSSSEQMLIIEVRILNKNPNKAIDFDSWTGDRQTLKASLTDNVHTYQRYVPEYGKKIYGNSPQETINPGKSWTETLAFELPFAGTKKLTLILPGENLGEKGTYKIEFNYRD